LCWIKITEQNRLLTSLEIILVCYLNIWILIIYSIFAAFKINRASENLNISLRRFINENKLEKLKFIPIIMIICWTFPCIYRIYGLITLRFNTLADQILSILISLPGMFNYFIFNKNNDDRVSDYLNGEVETLRSLRSSFDK
jgi:hypothetical protein